jgi:hypothetical protein
VEDEYSAKHQQMSIIKLKNVPQSSIFPSPKASKLGESYFDQNDSSSNDELSKIPHSVATTTPR